MGSPIQTTVNGFYQFYLGRDAEPSGLASWVTVYSIQGHAAVEAGIANSAEANSDEARTRVIHRLYNHYLGRDAEPGGLAHWIGVYRSQGRSSVESGIANSDEAKNREMTRIVNELYNKYLGRDAESGGLAHWIEVYRSQGRNSVESGIANSDEALIRKYPDTLIDPIITELYRQHLGRDPEPTGLNHWRGVYRKQGSEAVTSGIVNSDEALIRKYPNNVIDPIITQLYRQHLSRDPEPADLTHWRGVYRKQGSEVVASGIANLRPSAPVGNSSSNDAPPPYNPDGSPRWKVVARDANSVTIRFYDPCQVKLNDGLVSAIFSAFNGSEYTVRTGQGISLLWQDSWAGLSY